MFDLNEDQRLLAGTSRRFLQEKCRSNLLRDESIRRETFGKAYWRSGAEIGWTSLLANEEVGGGSVSGQGVLDLMSISYLFGQFAAPGPLHPTNVTVAALSKWGSPEQARLLPPLISGESTAAWVLTSADGGFSAADGQLLAADEGDRIVLTGTAGPVEAAAEADLLLVTAQHRGGSTQLLVPADSPGISITPLHTVDFSRRFARLDFDGVAVRRDSILGDPARGRAATQWLIDLFVVLQLAEITGAMQWAFDATLQWTFNRSSFGRILASYQEIKHRMADLKAWLEASYAIAAEAAVAVQEDRPDRTELASAGKCYVARYGPELIQDCIQLHGGIGVTFDHDLHLYLRRVMTDASTMGDPSDHASRVTSELQIGSAGR